MKPVRPRLPLTDADLRASWAALASVRPGIPWTFEAAMADPHARSLIRIDAVQQAQRRVQSVLMQRPLPAPARRGAPAHHHQVDHKRAAAGDRDD
jgi:hypothetical protein